MCLCMERHFEEVACIQTSGHYVMSCTCVVEINIKSDYFLLLYIYQLVGKPHKYVLVPE